MAEITIIDGVIFLLQKFGEEKAKSFLRELFPKSNDEFKKVAERALRKVDEHYNGSLFGGSLITVLTKPGPLQVFERFLNPFNLPTEDDLAEYIEVQSLPNDFYSTVKENLFAELLASKVYTGAMGDLIHKLQQDTMAIEVADKLKQISDKLREIQLAIDRNSTRISVDAILGKSGDYKDLVQKIEEIRETLLHIDDNPSHQAFKKKRREELILLESRLAQFKDEVIRLAKEFQNIHINNDRVRKAKEYFEKGNFEAGFNALDEQELGDEILRLKGKKEAIAKDVDEIDDKLRQLSSEYRLKASFSALTPANPDFFDKLEALYQKSVDAFEDYTSLYSLGHFYAQNNQSEKAVEVFRRALNKAEASFDKLFMLKYAIGTAYLKFDKVAARGFLNEAVTMSSTYPIDDPLVLSLLANTLHNLSSSYENNEEKVRELIRSVQVRRKAAALDTRMNFSLARTSSSLANCYFRLNEFDKFLEAFEKALTALEAFAAADLSEEVPFFEADGISGITFGLHAIRLIEPPLDMIPYRNRIAKVINTIEDYVVKFHKHEVVEIAYSFELLSRCFDNSAEEIYEEYNKECFQKSIKYYKESLMYQDADHRVNGGLAVMHCLLAFRELNDNNIILAHQLFVESEKFFDCMEKFDAVHERLKEKVQSVLNTDCQCENCRTRKETFKNSIELLYARYVTSFRQVAAWAKELTLTKQGKGSIAETLESMRPVYDLDVPDFESWLRLVSAKARYKNAVDEIDKNLSRLIAQLGTRERWKLGAALLLTAKGLRDDDESEVAKVMFETVLQIGSFEDTTLNRCLRAMAYNGLAGIYGELKNFREQIRYDRLAMDLIDKKLHWREGISILNSLGKAHYDLDEYEISLQCFEASLDLKREIGLSDSEIGSLNFFNIGCAKSGLKSEDAIDYKLKAVEIEKQQETVDNRQLIKYYNGIVVEYVKRNSVTEAEVYVNESLKIAPGTFGEGHPQVSEIHIGWAMALQGDMRYDESLPHFRAAIDNRKSILGKQDVDLYRFAVWSLTSFAGAKKIPEGVKYFKLAQDLKAGFSKSFLQQVEDENVILEGLASSFEDATQL